MHRTAVDISEFAADEIRAALSWTRRAAEGFLALAHDLVERLPHVWQALQAGVIDLARVRVIAAGVAGVDDDTARSVADQVLGTAGEHTTGQIAARLRRLVIVSDPDGATKRYEAWLEQRRVIVDANPEGTANLMGLDLPAERATAAMARVNHLARALKTGHDPRTIDQLRADVFLDLLEGNQAADGADRRGVVDIRVDLTTLMGLAETPGEIGGWGPVIADIIRRAVSERDTWQITVTDNGDIAWVGTTRRRPTTRQQRQIRTRRPVCHSPGAACPQPTPTSTTPSPTPTADPPQHGTSPLSAATTTAPNTRAAGHSNASHPTDTNGPAPTTTPTSSKPNPRRYHLDPPGAGVDPDPAHRPQVSTARCGVAPPRPAWRRSPGRRPPGRGRR